MAPWPIGSSGSSSSSSSSSVKTSSATPDTSTTNLRSFASQHLATLTSNFSSLPGLHASAENSKALTLLQDWQRSNDTTITTMTSEFPTLFTAMLASPRRKPGKGADAITEDHRLATRLLLLQARNANTGVTDPDKILDLFQDHGEHMLPVRSLVPIRASGTGGWLGVDWFRRSGYSPIQLEQHVDCHQHGSMWRAAFEDLLATTLDKPAAARAIWEGGVEDEGVYKAWGAPGIDWMLGLQTRGLLPPQLPSLYNISAVEKRKLDRVFGKVVLGKDLWTPYGKGVKRDFEKLVGAIASLEMGDLAVKEEEGRAETELELYEYFADQERSEVEEHMKKSEDDRQTEAQDKLEARKTDDMLTQSVVVATLTTTETTILPDGTSHSRRVLKQRFTDGREEIKEEVSSSRDGDKAGVAADADNADRSRWFWT